MRLLIAIPTWDTVRYEFAESLVKLCKHLAEQGVDYEVKFWESSLIYDARDGLAITALQGNFTNVLWLDSDVQFSIDIVDILRSVNKPFVTGIYRSRRSPYSICLYSNLGAGQRVIDVPNEPFKVEACGFGCVFMSVDVIHTLRREYRTTFRPMEGFGEDLAFCKRWIDLGNEIWAVPDAKVNHISYVILKPSDATKLVEYKELI